MHSTENEVKAVVIERFKRKIKTKDLEAVHNSRQYYYLEIVHEILK